MSFREMVVRTAALLAVAGTVAGDALAQGPVPEKEARTEVPGAAQARPALEQLRAAAERLRQSAEILGKARPGPDRDRAMVAAGEALLAAQKAMLALPVNYRTGGTDPFDGYDEVLGRLKKSSERMLEAAQTLSKRGDPDERAMKEARQALRDAQHAMLILPYEARRER